MLFGLLLHSKYQKATLVPKEAMILMIQSTYLSLATSTLAILKSKMMEILAITMGRQGRTIACNSQLKLSSNEYISFRDLPLLHKKIGRYLNILLSDCCCWIKWQFCISICFKSGTDGWCCVTKGKIRVSCLRFCCRAGFLSSNVISARVVETRVSG